MDPRGQTSVDKAVSLPQWALLCDKQRPPLPVPDFQSLMLPVLRACSAKEVRLRDVIEPIANEFGLSDDEKNELQPSGSQTLLYNRTAWAKFHLNKAGLIAVPGRGRFVATDEGRKLLATSVGPIDMHTLKEYPAYRNFIAKTSDNTETEAPAEKTVEQSRATPEEQIEGAARVLQVALTTDLLQRVLSSSPAFFERLIVDLLVGMGYGGSHANAARRLGKSGDEGIDGLVDEDRLGLDRIYVQAKRYSLEIKIGRPAIQGFVGSLVGHGATKGVFVTTSDFSSQAIDYVRHIPQRVILIGGERLCELMVEHNVGVRISRTLSLKRIDEDFFVEE